MFPKFIYRRDLKLILTLSAVVTYIIRLTVPCVNNLAVSEEVFA